MAVRLVGLAALAGPFLIAVAALSGWGHRAPDLLAQFTSPAALATAALALLFLMFRRLGWAAAAAIAAGLLILAAWPQWRPPLGEPQPGAPTLRLYSANLWARNEDVEAMAASIREANADIVVLIELGDAPSRRLDEVLAGYDHQVRTPRINRVSGAARSMIASRYPLRTLPDEADGLHSVAAQVETPLGPIDVVGIHLTRPWPFQEQWGQVSQTMALAALLGDRTGPVIVAGDFNSVSSARIGRQMKSETGLIPAPGFEGTWPSFLPGPLAVTIDHVWRSPELALLERRLGEPTGSDHRPVVTTFTRARG
jgi:endonuclease/exonuclease/phosphatase (EEP) superfamily protein YafD